MSNSQQEVDLFIQSAPRVPNRWLADPSLRRALRRCLPEHLFELAAGEALRLGGRCGGELADLGFRAEASPPVHVAYDAWGQRVDLLNVDEAWLKLVKVGQEIGLVSLPYENPYGKYSRVVQAAFIQLFSASTATAACPLSMTDAAVTVLRMHDPTLAEDIVPHLLDRSKGWTSGQWMTEKEGGSDLSRSATVARSLGDGTWALTGTKWFTSATTADVALVLARPQSKEGEELGSRGLSLFLVKLRNEDGSWNGLKTRRLKDKLGTRALPTAEMDLVDTVGVPVGGLGRGVPKVAAMLNIARLWSAYSAVSSVGQALALARDFSRRREVQGLPLSEQPAHSTWMAELAATYEAMVVLSFRAAEVQGQAEDEPGFVHLARVLPPLAKLACARQGVEITSQLLESFGGAGYLEDTGVPQLLRDVQVQCIWEGTTTILALDILRALRSPEVADALLNDIECQLTREPHPLLEELSTRVRATVSELGDLIKAADPAQARRLAWGLARSYQSALLCASAAWAFRQDGDESQVTAAQIFASRPLLDPDWGTSTDQDKSLAFPS